MPHCLVPCCGLGDFDGAKLTRPIRSSGCVLACRAVPMGSTDGNRQVLFFSINGKRDVLAEEKQLLHGWQSASRMTLLFQYKEHNP